MRIAEFTGKRGFRRHKETDKGDRIENFNRENHLPSQNRAKSKRRKGAHESDASSPLVSKKGGD